MAFNFFKRKKPEVMEVVEPRGYCRALKDIETMVRDMKQEGVTE